VSDFEGLDGSRWPRVSDFMGLRREATEIMIAVRPKIGTEEPKDSKLENGPPTNGNPLRKNGYPVERYLVTADQKPGVLKMANRILGIDRSWVFMRGCPDDMLEQQRFFDAN